MRLKVLLGATLIAAISWTAVPTQAAFPGTNGKIAFARYPRGSAPWEEIYTVNPNGSGQTRLTFSGGLVRSNVAPAVSPDGTMIAFARYTAVSGPPPDVSEIVIIDASSGAELDNFVAPPDTSYAYPAWSPDSTRLLVSRNEVIGDVYNQDIFVLEIASGVATQVTTTVAEERQPQWSPDGARISFAREVAGWGKVFVADIDPTTFALSNVTNVTGSGTAYADGDAKWHPTQDKLVLSRFKSGWGGSEIFVENLAMGTQKRHTNNSVYDAMPAFSPDGAFIVYSRGPEDLDSELIRQTVATGTKTIITSNNVVDQQADWGVQP